VVREGRGGAEAELGKNHPETLNSVNNMGLACAKAGDIEKAVEQISRVLTGIEAGSLSAGAPFQEKTASSQLWAQARGGGGVCHGVTWGAGGVV
jgi:hypothetical protein